MDRAVEVVLQEYDKRAEAENELLHALPFEELNKRLDEFLLAIGPATGQVLNILIKEAGSKTILELGTSYGYSTVWLAEAARETGGKVISLDVVAEKQQYALASLKKAGLADLVEFRLGDAGELLAAMKERIDFVLLDLWKNYYIACFDLIYPKINPGALIAADNMIEPEFSRPDAQKYQKHVRARRDMESILLPIGSGIELSRKNTETATM